GVGKPATIGGRTGGSDRAVEARRSGSRRRAGEAAGGMEGVTSAAEPFAYPTEPHCRRHGPSGYTDYQSYRPWLEDEFSFRCLYCLKRMVWAPTDVWSVDHIISQDEAK